MRPESPKPSASPVRAVALALNKEVDAICTAPVNKAALHAGGHRYPGHTEILAHLTGTPEVSMMLCTPVLRVIHCTTHVGLIDAIARRIERALAPRSVWVETEPEPALVKVANIQHLATPVHAQLSEPLSAIELAGLLHPTPAVGGEPRDVALRAIAELELMDRGWYAGPVGWMDAAEDGEFCVALRSALLRDRIAHLYAGAGIVGDSDPEAELAETELKLEAMLPLLAG